MYTYSTMRTRIIIFLLSITLVTQHTFAQVATTSINGIPFNKGGGGIPELEEKVSYTVLPERPRIGDVVDIQAEMYGTPVQNAIFTWKVNGVLYKKAQGLVKVSVLVNKNTKVSLEILTEKGTTLYKDWTFNPQNIIIFWEAHTYTPPFYKGKPFYTSESNLILQGINLDAKNPLTNTYANYVWKIDGVVQGNDSGVSRKTFAYTGNILQLEPLFELIYTSVTNYQDAQKSTAVNARAILRVQTQQAETFAYEKKPLLGVLLNKIIENRFILKDKETSFVAYPVYFSTAVTSGLEYMWTINNTLVKQNINTLSFKKVRDNEQSLLGIRIKNPKSILQSQNTSYVIDTTIQQDSSPVEQTNIMSRFGN